MRLLTALFTAAFMTIMMPAFAEENRTLGTPITKDNIVDVFEIQRIVTNLTLAVDPEQWEVVSDLLHGDVETTIGESVNGTPVVKPEA